LKQSIGASTEYLVFFTRALNRWEGLATAQEDIELEAKSGSGEPPLKFLIPLAALARELRDRLPLASVARDLPRGRKRPGWKMEFQQALQEAAVDLGELSEADILAALREHKRPTRMRPAISVVTQSESSTSARHR
jgi:hypothetical protein